LKITHRFMQCDAREHIAAIPDSYVDVILTDPPYNLLQHTGEELQFTTRKNLNRGTGSFDALTFCPGDWLQPFQRILKPRGNLLVFCAYNFLVNGDFARYNRPSFDVLQVICWHKTDPVNNMRGTSLTNSNEYIIACWNTPHTYNYPLKADGTRDYRANHAFLPVASVLASDTYESGHTPNAERVKLPDNTVHPTQKPLKLLRQLIHQFSNPGDTVYDPFSGVGSTEVACIELDRRYLGCEIDPVYFQAASERIKQARNVLSREKFRHI
jgi:DNA modification methylase